MVDKEEQKYINDRNRADQDFITKEAIRILKEKKNGKGNKRIRRK